MAIEVTSDTVIKIIVRRGTDAERQQITLTEGEIGYTIDSKRLFVGDGITQGGNIVGNLYLGSTPDRVAYAAGAVGLQFGDLIWDSTEGILFSYDSSLGGDPWKNLHPNFDTFQFDTSTATVMINSNFAGVGFTIGSAVQGSTKSLEFDTRYFTLCSILSSFYVGDVKGRQTNNTGDATLNIANNLFINSHLNTNQIQIDARTNTLTATSGILTIGSPTNIALNNTTFVNGRIIASNGFESTDLTSSSTTLYLSSNALFQNFTGALGAARSINLSKSTTAAGREFRLRFEGVQTTGANTLSIKSGHTDVMEIYNNVATLSGTMDVVFDGTNWIVWKASVMEL